MANFDKSFDKLILTEGGYVNDPDDKGGETYLGISRVHHPDSLMWPLIDTVKESYGTKGITKVLKENEAIINEAKSIYKEDYWNKFDLDNVNNQKIAHEIFDDAVNRGVGAATKTLRLILGMELNNKIDKELLNKIKEYGK